MRILAAVLLLALTACTATEQGVPTKQAWLDGKLTFRVVTDVAPTSKPSSGYQVPQKDAADPAVQAAKSKRQSTDDAVRKEALAALDCAAPDPLVGHDDAAAPLVTCDAGENRYDLGPVALDGERIAKATSSFSPNGSGHVITIEFDAEGARTWGDFTTANVQKQVAILINGRVLSAPTIQSPITGGSTEISGRFTAAEAKQLAEQLNQTK
ncbi:SecDF P1 head subdomain-containing protein [Lentzea sp. CA-135723]|uniref:SecDF P1 head subdomain-containing protein n=1 Tax=Lentzea sp. CA-135723 TaxID=3239950 RepID=UPI003D8D2C9A